MLLPAISLSLVFILGVILGRLPMRKDLRQARRHADSLTGSLCSLKLTLSGVCIAAPEAYAMTEEPDRFYVYSIKSGGDRLVLIKTFPKSDDPAYARLCAEELLEKLRER